MLRKALIVGFVCCMAITAPSEMYAVQARPAISANPQFAKVAGAARTPTATSETATKTPTATVTSKSKTPAATSKSGKKRDLNDPKGATAKCNDGTYYHGTSHRGACSNHKGVKEWLKP